MMHPLEFKMIKKSLLNNIEPSKKVCRKLFGDVNHEELNVDLKKECKEIIKQKSIFWNFDFDKDIPNIAEESNITWSPINYKKLRSVGKNLITQSKSINEKTDSNELQNYSSSSDDTNTTGEAVLVSNNVVLNSNNKDLHYEKRRNPETIKDYFPPSSQKEDTEDNSVIKIVNESPQRPILNPKEITKIKMNEQSSHGGRKKRSLQPKIDGKKGLSPYKKKQLPKRCFFFIRKETLAQVFSCEFCEISKDTFSYRAPLVTASVPTSL